MPGRDNRKLNSHSRRLGSTLRDVWEAIRSQPGRAGLSVLAIAIGMASLTVVIAVLGGLREKSDELIEELGVNVVGILQQGELDHNARARLHERHASLLAVNLPNCSISTISLYKVPTLGTAELLSVVATDSSLIHIRQWELHEGRFLDHWDIENRERHAVVSKSLSELWNWRVGNLIMLQNTAFRIVGIVRVGGGALGTELGDSGLMLGERVVFVPKTLTPYWVTTQESSKLNIDAIFLRVPTSLNFAHVVSLAQRLLSQPGYRVGNVSWVTPESLIQGVKKLQNTISLTVGSIAVLSLVLGGMTLMSLMVANVKDRVTEIGLRRAMGASQWDITALFVLEACLVAGTAAVVATLGTHLLLVLGRGVLPVPLRLGLVSILAPFVIAVILGMVFSYWPAKVASKITPSEALRNE